MQSSNAAPEYHNAAGPADRGNQAEQSGTSPPAEVVDLFGKVDKAKVEAMHRRDLGLPQGNGTGKVWALVNRSTLEACIEAEQADIASIADVLHASMATSLAFDEATGQVVVREGSQAPWRPMTDEDVTMIRIVLTKSNKLPGKVGKDDTREALNLIARQRSFDSFRDWLLALPRWDGEERVSEFFSRYLGAENTAYTRAAARYFWTARVARILEPGCQVDSVVVLKGPQGFGKSQAIKALLPDPKHYAEIDLAARDAEAARLMRGKLIAELAELKGLRGRDSESIKAWITRMADEFRDLYRSTTTIQPRRCVFVGTTNQDEFLNDPTGNRRWLPIEVGVTRDRADLGNIRAGLAQLFAEALDLYFRRVHDGKDGVAWDDVKELAEKAQAQATERDAWDDAIARWLQGRAGEKVTTAQVLTECLYIPPKDQSHGLLMRVGPVLARLGCTKGKAWIDKQSRACFTVPESFGTDKPGGNDALL